MDYKNYKNWGKDYWMAFYAVQHDEDCDTFRLCQINYFGG